MEFILLIVRFPRKYQGRLKILAQGQTQGARVLAPGKKLVEMSSKVMDKSRLYEKFHQPETLPPLNPLHWFFFWKIQGQGESIAETAWARPQGYLARPVTTVWAQGTMISLKLPWSKNPLCQDPFRAVGRSVEAQAGGWLLRAPDVHLEGRLLCCLSRTA